MVLPTQDDADKRRSKPAQVLEGGASSGFHRPDILPSSLPVAENPMDEGHSGVSKISRSDLLPPLEDARSDSPYSRKRKDTQRTADMEEGDHCIVTKSHRWPVV